MPDYILNSYKYHYKEKYLRRILREKGVTRIGLNYVKDEFIMSFRTCDNIKSDDNVIKLTAPTNKPLVINSSSAKNFVDELLNK